MGHGLVNHVCVPSDVSHYYAPPDRSLVCVSIIGVPDLGDTALDRRVREDLGEWFGRAVEEWRLLRVYRIARALPRILPSPDAREVSREGIFVCGDYLASPSLNGAMASGRHTAEAVLLSLQQG
jgi:hypothetical protein